MVVTVFIRIYDVIQSVSGCFTSSGPPSAVPPDLGGGIAQLLLKLNGVYVVIKFHVSTATLPEEELY